MEEIITGTELRLCQVKRENLRNTMEKLKPFASDLLVFSLQWSDADDYLRSVEEKVEKRFSELQSKSLELEERAKVVEAAEAKMGCLEMKVEEKRKEFDLIRNQVEVCVGESKVEEMRLTQLKKSVEECVVEERLKRSQLNEMDESLRKCQVEIDLKRDELVKMKTDLEMHRVEFSAENEHLCRTRSRRCELEEEIEKKTKDLSLILDKTVECEKMLETRSSELGKTQSELELKGKQLELINIDLERYRGEVCAEMKLLDGSQTRNRELEEEIERKRKDLADVLDRISECGKQHELVEEQLVSQQKILDARSAELSYKEKKLVDLSLDIDLKEQTVKTLNDEMDETSQQMESKAKKLEDIERRIDERSSYDESIMSLIKEHSQELASKEKKQTEKTEALRKLSLEIVTEEKTLERAKVFSKQLSEKHRELERKLDSTRRHLERCTAKYETKKKELCVVSDTLRDRLQDQEKKESEIQLLQSLLTERNVQVEEAEKRMQHLDNSNEELSRILQGKQEELCSVNKAIKECSDELEIKRNHCEQVQRSATDLTAELKSKECDLNSVKKKIQDNVKDFQSKEEQQAKLQASLMEREKDLGIKEKALDAREESIDNKDQLLKSMEQKLAKCVKDYEKKAKELASFCQQSNPDQQVDMVLEKNASDKQTLQLLLRGHLKKCSELHPELVRALKASADPAKLVLDTIQGHYSAHQMLTLPNFDRNNVQRSSICLLECLLDMSPKPSTEVQGEAIKFATEWKETTLVKAEDPVEVLGFLHFLAAFSSAYTFDSAKVQDIFDLTFLRKYTPSLFEALGVSSLALVNNGQTVDDKPEQQPLEAPNNNGNDSRSQDVEENVASTHLDNEDALKDLDGSASFSSNEVFTGLQFMEDPSSYVLNFVNDALMGAHQRGELGLAEPIVKTLVPLLEELPRVVTSSDHLQSEARQVAELWRLMMGTSSKISPLETWGLLHLIVAYGLVDSTRKDQILQFASYVAHFRKAPKLFQSLGLSFIVPDFVKQLLNQCRYIPAIRFIWYFNLKNMFSTVELLKEEIINLKRYAKEKRRFESQVEERDAEKLRDIIELVDDFKLDIDLPVDLIIKFMVPREAQKQNQCVLFSSGPPPIQPQQTVPPASHPVIHSSYMAAARGLNHPSAPIIFGVPLNQQQVPNMETTYHQASGSTAFQAQSSSHRTCFKRPRVEVDPRVTSSAIRPCFNPSSGNGRF